MRRAVVESPFSKPEENSASFFRRFYLYQKERFPFLGHGLLVACFSFSAIAYSRICRGAAGFVGTKIFLSGILITISLFLLVRIFDEFKDAEDDALYRGDLPVPRGLVSLRELGWVAVVIFVMQISVILYCYPQMLWLYLLVIAYLLLMGKEFFIASWLKKHQFWYVTSHMFIIPLVDMYASGLDWKLAGANPARGLLFFFAVSYMNGIVLEIGRKIRVPDMEAEGVLTYSGLLGANKAVLLWLCVLVVTLSLSIAASLFAGYGMIAFIVLGCVFILCSIPAFIFLSWKTPKMAKGIELASALWTMAMYLTLGGGPMISKLFFK
ncbi:UbiA prenyltransferase family protein [Mucilaginibacter paludis]|uniref:UbiA prenyltransferase n=1 Tax=Mucilaginibacter paludis DSM 18603 TaxID=714943 RepID=H1Y1E3_9SPHI|nr:membrane protein [Mucilaginibacter paludis]EHQ30277.1 UbiA prenyltransferase [Mucilaginibacter paludis DSM 18603]